MRCRFHKEVVVVPYPIYREMGCEMCVWEIMHDLEMNNSRQQFCFKHNKLAQKISDLIYDCTDCFQENFHYGNEGLDKEKDD